MTSNAKDIDRIMAQVKSDVPGLVSNFVVTQRGLMIELHLKRSLCRT